MERNYGNKYSLSMKAAGIKPAGLFITHSAMMSLKCRQRISAMKRPVTINK